MSEEKATYMGKEREEHAYEIRDESSPRDFYTQIPNLVDIMNLSPHAYRLYGHIRKVAGESGKCWQSTKTLAQSCNMSTGKVSESKEELENAYPPLIRVESKKSDNGYYHEIVVTDIWQINHDFFSGKDVTIRTSTGVVHNMNEYRSQYELGRSQYETKNNPIKNNPEHPENLFSSAKRVLTPEEMEEVKEDANRTVDIILAQNKAQGFTWKGREFFRDNHLVYADWYHEKTNQVCGKKSQRSWQKAFSAWQDEDLAIADLKESYDIDIVWKKVIGDPNELTKKAVAIKAARTFVRRVVPDSERTDLDEDGIPQSYM